MMTPLLYSVAYSLLRARGRQTLVAAIGVTFSITMFITLLSFMSGLNQLLDGLVLNRTPHVRLYNELKPAPHQPIDLYSRGRRQHNFIHSIKPSNELPRIRNSAAVMAAIRLDPRVLGVAPKIQTQVFYNVGTLTLNGTISGIAVEEENALFAFSDYVVAGNFLSLKTVPNSIILGKGAADLMLTDLGDVIQVTTPRGERVQLKVVGLFQSGLLEIDKVQSYTSLATAQKLLGESSQYVTDIQVKLHDRALAPAVAQEYQQLYEVEALDIQTANSEFETGTFVRTLISYAVGITLLTVAGFGIYNILNMMIYEKMDTIAILKAVGFSGQDVQRIFVLVALSIGVFGGALGLVGGLGLSALIGQLPFHPASLPTVHTYPIDFNPVFYGIAGVFALITTFLAGYFPARKASQIDPVIIIRGK
ncbi:lipoprotein-releasing system permease protein [Hymenobacter gelipurpurascens]|uniref:Lipoprotein-releasing system permease protein n=1 Tax=Hymenobacter gelipurpurascens TaxID=89968 RepID=A0A212UHM4_9BACT|nr:FtsX-like permease family protein [Hymenobacter gelipurpurascens]SNC77663.1 lipoprotein-releasing system permease protein [Hymenobacter gelipurpurascens]